jgi:hypothetical protein
MVGDVAIEPKAAKPAIRQVQVDLFTQPPLDRMPKQYPTSSIRIINSGAIEGRPIML